MSDLIRRQDAIDKVDSETVSTNPEHFKSSEKFIKFMDNADIASFGKWQWANGFNTALVAIGVQLKKLPSAQPDPTLYGYPIEHLVMIARVMAKENCTPEIVAQMLQNAGEIAKMVRDEMMEMLNESIGIFCKGAEYEEGTDHCTGFRQGRIPDRL